MYNIQRLRGEKKRLRFHFSYDHSLHNGFPTKLSTRAYEAAGKDDGIAIRCVCALVLVEKLH